MRWRTKLSLADADGVAGVVAAVVAGHDLDLLREQVHDLALAFVAPLGADDHDVGHGRGPHILAELYIAPPVTLTRRARCPSSSTAPASPSRTWNRSRATRRARWRWPPPAREAVARARGASWTTAVARRRRRLRRHHRLRQLRRRRDPAATACASCSSTWCAATPRAWASRWTRPRRARSCCCARTCWPRASAASGRRRSTCWSRCSTRGVHPVVPSQGSVGASGDLAPLAHLALALVGEGACAYEGRRRARRGGAGRGRACGRSCSRPRKAWPSSTARSS